MDSTIEPQVVKEEQAIVVPVVTDGELNGSMLGSELTAQVNNGTTAAVVQSTTHNYSTRSKETISKSALKQKHHNVVIHPRLKPVPFKLSDLHSYASKTLGKNQVTTFKDSITFYNSEDHPINKRGYKYKPCSPNPIFPSNLYSTTEFPPFKVCPSYFDRAPGIIFNESMDCVSTLDGWRSIRTNIGIREGSFYMEFNIINANNGEDRSHVRIGVARREAALEAPVGFDGYGYGIRDVNGQKITLSRPKDFMKSVVENSSDAGFKNGDVIGLVVTIPSLEKHKKHLEEFVHARRSESTRTTTPTPSATPTPMTGSESQQLKKKRKLPTKKDDGGAASKSSKKHDTTDNSTFQLHDNILRDQIPIKYKSLLYYEQYEYTPTKKMDHLLNPVTVFGEKAILEKTHSKDDASKDLPIIPDSKIVVYKNGKEIGTMFENLYSFLPVEVDAGNISGKDNNSNNIKQSQNPAYRDTDDGSLGYYPMISVYQNGVVQFNAGPNFKYPPPELATTDLRPLSDRYDEVVAEDWLWDLIDEVEAEYLDSYDEV